MLFAALVSRRTERKCLPLAAGRSQVKHSRCTPARADVDTCILLPNITISLHSLLCSVRHAEGRAPKAHNRRHAHGMHTVARQQLPSSTRSVQADDAACAGPITPSTRPLPWQRVPASPSCTLPRWHCTHETTTAPPSVLVADDSGDAPVVVRTYGDGSTAPGS